MLVAGRIYRPLVATCMAPRRHNWGISCAALCRLLTSMAGCSWSNRLALGPGGQCSGLSRIFGRLFLSRNSWGGGGGVLARRGGLVAKEGGMGMNQHTVGG